MTAVATLIALGKHDLIIYGLASNSGSESTQLVVNSWFNSSAAVLAEFRI